MNFFSDRYIGCFADLEWNRALESLLYDVRNMNDKVNSNGRCIRVCASNGYTYAGTEVGKFSINKLALS